MLPYIAEINLVAIILRKQSNSVVIDLGFISAEILSIYYSITLLKKNNLSDKIAVKLFIWLSDLAGLYHF